MRIAMRWTWMRTIGTGVAVVASALAVATHADAEERSLYRWETADGTVAFTDDAKRVPEKYQATAEAVERTDLADYGRYTATDQEANDEYADRLAARIESLRAVNEGEEEPAIDERRANAVAGVRPRVQRQMRRFRRADGSYNRRYTEVPASSVLALPVDPNDPNPVVTEQKRVSIPGRLVTETVTVVRQGDRVLSIERPESAEHTDDYRSITELLD
jgi:hypothetical protein